MSSTPTVRVAMIGAGRIGSNHAGIVAHQVPGAPLVAVADPRPNAERLAAELDAASSTSRGRARPGRRRRGADHRPRATHTDLVVAAAAAGKHVFCEKPMAVTLADADRAIAAAERAGVVLQVGFNRRFAPGFAAARAAIDARPHRHPAAAAFADPRSRARSPPTRPAFRSGRSSSKRSSTTSTPCASSTPARARCAVHAVADALVAPGRQEPGHLDTAVVTIQFDNGAIATAEANFSALYGYDVRAEVFGSGGMVTAGSGRQHRHDALRRGRHARRHRPPRHRPPARRVRGRTRPRSSTRSAPARRPRCTGADARTALVVALAAIRASRPAPPSTWTGDTDDHVHARRQRRDALPRPAVRWTASSASPNAASRWRSGTGRPRTSTRSPPAAPNSPP